MEQQDSPEWHGAYWDFETVPAENRHCHARGQWLDVLSTIGAMIAAGIFLCLFLLLLSTLRRRGWVTIILFILTLVLIALLFLHHATEHLPIDV